MTALVERLGASDPAAHARLRTVVADRSALIAVDDESVWVAFSGDDLMVREQDAGAADGEGRTDRMTVLDLLDGYVEVSDALLQGRIEVRGDAAAVAAMLAAIEVLLDASPRAPTLQRLADDYRADPCLPPPYRPRPHVPQPRVAWYPRTTSDEEAALLARLDLLDGPDG